MSDDIHEGNATEGGQPSGTGTRTFTQEELNRIVGDRATRAGERASKDLLTRLGFPDWDAVEKALESARKAEEAQLSEREKLEKARDELAQQLAEVRGETSSLASALKQERLHRLVEAEAYRLNFSDPTDAVRLLDLQVFVGEDGDKPPTSEAVQKALKALADSKAYLLKSAGKPSPPSTNAGAGGTGGGPAKEKADEEKAHIKAGERFLPPSLRPRSKLE